MQGHVAQEVTAKSLGGVRETSDCTGDVEQSEEEDNNGDDDVEMISESHVEVG